MTINQFKNSFKTIGTVILTAGVSHFTSKGIDYRKNAKIEILQAENSKKIDNINEGLSNLQSSVDNTNQALTTLKQQLENFKGNNVLDEQTRQLLTQGFEKVEKGKSELELVDKFKELFADGQNPMLKINEGISDIQKALDLIINNGGKDNNFTSLNIGNFSLEKYYEYLDSLSLLEESAFLHLVAFSLIIFIILNIVSTLFGNEIIQYFNLEKKYPKLSIFFRLRAKFQRYYLIWNISILLFICTLGIFMNLIIFY
jgi:hypothetical protein